MIMNSIGLLRVGFPHYQSSDAWVWVKQFGYCFGPMHGHTAYTATWLAMFGIKKPSIVWVGLVCTYDVRAMTIASKVPDKSGTRCGNVIMKMGSYN